MIDSIRTNWISGILFICCLALTILSCEEDDYSNSELSGIWIEFTNRLDTIDFDSYPAENVFILRRGFELKNGYILPKFGSGIYKYELKPDTIIIYNMASSCMCYTPYYFRMNSSDQTLNIGNFYDTTLNSSHHRTFIRIK